MRSEQTCNEPSNETLLAFYLQLPSTYLLWELVDWDKKSWFKEPYKGYKHQVVLREQTIYSTYGKTTIKIEPQENSSL